MVTGRGVEGVVRRADPAERGDIGEFANPRVGDVGVTVAIGVIPEGRVIQAATTPDFDVSAKAAVDNIAIGVDEWVGSTQSWHDQKSLSSPEKRKNLPVSASVSPAARSRMPIANAAPSPRFTAVVRWGVIRLCFRSVSPATNLTANPSA